MNKVIENRIDNLNKNRVDDIIKDLITNSLVDISVVGVESRIKKYDSVIEKMKRKKYKSICEVKDLLGVSIICKNLRDVYNVENRIMKIFENSAIKDYIKKNKYGYRGIHVYNKINIKGIKNIPLEIQIKTVAMKKAQDKTHDKIYKNKYLPDTIKKVLNYIISNYIIVKEILFNKDRLSENYM